MPRWKRSCIYSYHVATQAITSPSRQCRTGWGGCCKLVSLGSTWTAQDNTWLLIKLMPKGVVFSFHFFWEQLSPDSQTATLPRQSVAVCLYRLAKALVQYVSRDPNCLLVSTWPWKSWSLLLRILCRTACRALACAYLVATRLLMWTFDHACHDTCIQCVW